MDIGPTIDSIFSYGPTILSMILLSKPPSDPFSQRF